MAEMMAILALVGFILLCILGLYLIADLLGRFWDE